MKFLNCSNHTLTEVQVKDLAAKGVTEILNLPEGLKVSWGQLTPENYIEVCNDIIKFAYTNDVTNIHLAGFMPAVTYMCKKYEGPFMFWYSYSVRESIEREIDGKIVKTAVFNHKGWYLY